MLLANVTVAAVITAIIGGAGWKIARDRAAARAANVPPHCAGCPLAPRCATTGAAYACPPGTAPTRAARPTRGG